MPAESMYSYSDTLYAILDAFKPRSVFEWGPGTSTQIIALYPSVESLKSVEHDENFYGVVSRLNLPNTTVCHRPSMDEYVNEIGSGNFYDLIFIDGRDRARCLDVASACSNLILLHDAARINYRDAVDSYRFQVWTDEGNTVALTDDADTYLRLMDCLRKLDCDKPNPEVIRVTGKSRAFV